MIVCMFFELNENFDPTELSDLAQTLISKGLYPAEGVKDIAWYITTDYWGISISEVEDEKAIMNEINMWRTAKPGIFKSVRTAIGMQVQDILPLLMKLKKKIKE